MVEENTPMESGWSGPGMMEPLFPSPTPMAPEPAMSFDPMPVETAAPARRKKAKKAAKKKKAAKGKKKGKKTKAKKSAKKSKRSKKGKRR
jgi:hypothetical protein